MMYKPVLVTAPTITPVSLADAKMQLAVDHDEHDDMISGFIAAAAGHLDGWVGILGRALVEQTWRQDFDGFGGCMRLPLYPALSITSIVATDSAGAPTTIADSDYALMEDAAGSFVRFKSGAVLPSDLNAIKPVAVTYKAGYATVPAVPGDPAIPAQSSIPAAIKAAILIHVRLMYDAYRLGADAGPIPTDAIDALVAPFRRVSF
ncbi:head-tail connector protein [Devosia alba]|uniref:head-tail connector protein n=1 Tax=Devosia alba TaxID=3152360 RepID=UPI003266E3B6